MYFFLTRYPVCGIDVTIDYIQTYITCTLNALKYKSLTSFTSSAPKLANTLYVHVYARAYLWCPKPVQFGQEMQKQSYPPKKNI